MSDPWDSAEFSIERAYKHASDFNTIAKEFMEREPYKVFGDLNAETGLREIKIKITKEIPKDLRGLASDAIKNIRDALDQSISAATFVLTERRPRRTHFPFGDSEDDLENSLSRRKAPQCRDIPEELFPAIRFIKPYPHQGDEFRLKLLQKVSGPHKHSVSLTLGWIPAMPISTLGFENSKGKSFRIDFPEWSGSKKEGVIATYPPVTDGELKFHVPIHIALDHPELRRIPAAAVIDKWGRRTDWIMRGLKKTAVQIVAERS